MKIIYSEKFLEYKEPGHPESPERLKAIIDFLRKKGLTRFEEPQACSEEDLLQVHSPELVEAVRKNDFFDPDTPNLPGIFDYAKLACGAALKAGEFALSGQPAFSLARPPGHHAGRRYPGGFCYFNNMAVAVKKILRLGKKVAVLDLDGHHGNGTEEILIGEKDALYVSLHQAPGYPGTGLRSFGNCLNFPLLPGTGSARYRESFLKALEPVQEFAPEILGISLGSDTHLQDPLLELNLRDSDYYFLAREIRKLNIKFFVLLEGGYNTSVIGNACYCFVQGAEEKEKTKEKEK